MTISAVYSIDHDECRNFCEANDVSIAAESYKQLLENCDAVYVATPHYTHYQYVKDALEAGKHVLCETPFVLKIKKLKSC